jgi:hypothetical protein
MEQLGVQRGTAMPRQHCRSLLERTVQRNWRSSFCRPRYNYLKPTPYFACKDLSPPLKSGVTFANELEICNLGRTYIMYIATVVEMEGGVGGVPV